MNRDLKRETDRRSARRKAAVRDGRNPELVTGEPRSLARTRLPKTRVPLIARPACESADPDLFFSDVTEDIAAAVVICQGCPGRLLCLAGAVERREVFGVWGGTDFNPEHENQELAS